LGYPNQVKTRSIEVYGWENQRNLAVLNWWKGGKPDLPYLSRTDFGQSPIGATQQWAECLY